MRHAHNKSRSSRGGRKGMLLHVETGIEQHARGGGVRPTPSAGETRAPLDQRKPSSWKVGGRAFDPEVVTIMGLRIHVSSVISACQIAIGLR
jgi:hypothetical protein